MKALKEGKNKIELNFTSLDKALNRNEDYMYTLFVPDLARSVFPVSTSLISEPSS